MPVGVGAADLPAGPLTKGLQKIFIDAYKSKAGSGLASLIATVTQSTSDSEDYPFLGAVPKVRKFEGERRFKDLTNFNLNIKNELWESSLEVPRIAVEDGKLGMIKMRVVEMAHEAVKHKDELVADFLTGALAAAAAPYLCYDGQGFFDTDHPAPNYIGGAVQVNRAGTALASATLWAAIMAMGAYRDDTGRILSISPNLLIVEPCLEQTALELLLQWGSPKGGGSGANAALVSKSIAVHVEPLLTSTSTAANGNWFLADTTRPIKPIILQERAPVEFVAKENQSDVSFARDAYQYGTRARYNVGAGPWFTIYGNAGAGA